MNMLTHEEYIERIRMRHPHLKDLSTVGVQGSRADDVGIDIDENDIEGFATTDNVDEVEEVLLPEGADRSYFDRTKILYADHRYDLASILGKVRYIRPGVTPEGNRGWEFRAHVLTRDNPALGGKVIDIVRQLGTIGVSIGYEPIEWGSPTQEEAKAYPKAKSIVRKWKMLEVSLTGMPCNSQCFARAVKPMGKSRVTQIESGDPIACGALGLDTTHPRRLKLIEPKRLRLK